MKKTNFLFLAVVLFIFSYSNITGQDIKYKKIRKAEGTLNWKLEDKDGNVIKEGSVVDGEWRQHGGFLKDYLILEKSDENEIQTALIFLGTKNCPMLSMSMQVYFNGTFYPGKNFRKSYIFKPKDWADSGERYGMGNSQIMIFKGSAASCKYRIMEGCMINQIVIPDEKSFLQLNIEDKYTFYLLGGTDYKWEK